MTVLYSMVWQSVGEQSSFAELERHGVRYLKPLVQLEIALTNAESIAVNGDAAPAEPVARAVDAVSAVDKELGEELRTQERWTELRKKIEALPARGTHQTVTAAYGDAGDLLLALIDKVRNNSKLIRDPEAETYYLGDGATQELPAAVVAATRYTDLLVNAAGSSAAGKAQAVVDISVARSELVSNAQDLYDNARLAVEGSGSRSLGGDLLSKFDRFNRSVEKLVPLMTPMLDGKGRVDAAQVVSARDEAQDAAAELSEALLAQIDVALQDRLSSLSQRRLLATGVLAVAVLLALAPVAAGLASRRRPDTAADDEDPKQTPPPAPAHQRVAAPVAVASTPWPTQSQWPDSRPHGGSDVNSGRRERFGVPQ
ncbi:hypothetical protein [Actinoplanes sp. NPDC049802]|uniref:hypothetical protein n=1 Tax=Actinoplanes sp. NPDC049802 TaxID=3154742 RepID=UPI0033FFB11B